MTETFTLASPRDTPTVDATSSGELAHNRDSTFSTFPCIQWFSPMHTEVGELVLDGLKICSVFSIIRGEFVMLTHYEDENCNVERGV